MSRLLPFLNVLLAKVGCSVKIASDVVGQVKDVIVWWIIVWSWQISYQSTVLNV